MYRGRNNINGNRGRGRSQSRGRGRGRARGVRGRVSTDFTNEMDFPVQMWPENNESTSSRGRGRGQYSNPQSRSATPNGQRGSDSPRGRFRRGRASAFDQPNFRGRGRGRGSNLRPDAPLSKLLYAERPFLRPVIFVRSLHTATLFQEEEEIFKAVVEDVGDEEQSHVPTADRVARVFSGGHIPQMDSPTSGEDGSGEEELEEIAFEDMARVREEIDALPTPEPSSDIIVVEEKFTGIFINRAPTPSSDQYNDSHIEPPVPHDLQKMGDDTLPLTASIVPDNIVVDDTQLSLPISSRTNDVYERIVDDTHIDSPSTPETADPSMGFFIDIDPAPVANITNGGLNQNIAPLGHLEPSLDQEEIIVYVAPHPRLSQAAPALPTPTIHSVSSTSILTGTTQPAPIPVEAPSTPIPRPPEFNSVAFSFADSPSPTKQPRQPPVFTAGAKKKAAVKARQKEMRAARRRAERRVTFGSFGAMMSEAQLSGNAVGKDPRWDKRRRGDSDVEWGDEEGEAIDDPSGMDLDPDLVIDIDAMKGFVHGMSADGSQAVTMDDIADIEKIRKEDEEEARGRDAGSSAENSSDDSEADEIVEKEEVMIISEPREISIDSDETESDNSSSGDEDESPRRGFQTRLERLRNNARGKRIADVSPSPGDDDSSDDDPEVYPTRADEDDDFIAEIQGILDENQSILTGRDRKARNAVFKAVRDGAFENTNDFSPATRRKDKEKNIPPELLTQWKKDRDRKAEFKRARAEARLIEAADPLSQKRGGKKGRKAMLVAAKLDPSVIVPNRIMSMITLEQQIRRFINNIDGRHTMVLPPMDKATRENAHEMALAFNLKSQSKGRGDARYITLSKTTKTGFGINEQKVRIVVKRSEGGYNGPVENRDKRNRPVMPRHKDGDEVGKAAPKIGASNIGFQMLSSMGWAEGDRIGSSGGLDAPLTAVIKNTKLGLGANR